MKTSKFKPLLCVVTWMDPKSTHDNYSLDDVIVGKGCSVQRDRQTTGFLCHINEEYLEVYSDYDAADNEVGGGTAIFHVLIHKIKMVGKGIVFRKE